MLILIYIDWIKTGVKCQGQFAQDMGEQTDRYIDEQIEANIRDIQICRQVDSQKHIQVPRQVDGQVN